MSYSVCLDCKNMVSRYEKYCGKCAPSKKSNDPEFWKTHGYDYLNEPLRTVELEKDERRVAPANSDLERKK